MIKLLCAGVILTSTFGCSTTRPFGADVSMPTSERWSNALQHAATQKATWVPLVGAVTFVALDVDDDVSDWAVEENPIFGSKADAAQASDDLLVGLLTGVVGTSLLAGLGDDDYSLAETGTGFGIEFLGAGSALATTFVLKRAIGRERPDGSSNKSMPSGHATHAFAYANWIDHNLGYYRLNPTARNTLTYTSYTAATLTAWARVEAEKHHPSDVLVGAAIANFFTDFFAAAFFATDTSPLTVDVPVGGGLTLGWEWNF